VRIKDVQVFEVDVPWAERIRGKMARAGMGTGRYVYRVRTDDGLVGLGEGGDARSVIPSLLGRNPFDFILDDTLGPLQPAVYDLMGKALGIPVHKLFGPVYRERVPVAYWSHCLPPGDLAKEAEVAAENGFQVHKVKARPWFDIVEQVDAVSKAAPEGYQFVVDANCTFWLPSRAVSIARRLEKYNILCLESPIPQQDVNGYVAIRSKTGIPLAMHMGGGSGAVWTPHPFTAIERGMCDYFVVEEDGAAATLRCGAIAEVAIGSASASGGFTVGGMPLFIEVVGLGITEAFGLHLAAAIKNATLPSITLVHSQLLREDDLIKEPLKVKEGHADLPKGPGLGVELDERALEKYRVR